MLSLNFHINFCNNIIAYFDCGKSILSFFAKICFLSLKKNSMVQLLIVNVIFLFHYQGQSQSSSLTSLNDTSPKSTTSPINSSVHSLNERVNGIGGVNISFFSVFLFFRLYIKQFNRIIDNLGLCYLF